MRVGAMLAAMLAAAACGTGARVSVSEKSLVGTSWTAQEIDGRATIESTRPDLAFEKKEHASGTTGCNRFAGPVSIDGTAIRLGPLVATRRGCPEAVMDQEHRFLAALEEARTIRLDWGTLVLLDGSGQARVTLTQARPEEEKSGEEKPSR